MTEPPLRPRGERPTVGAGRASEGTEIVNTNLDGGEAFGVKPMDTPETAQVLYLFAGQSRVGSLARCLGVQSKKFGVPKSA